MRVVLSALLTTLLASAARAQESGVSDATASVSASLTASASGAAASAEWKIEDSIPAACAGQCAMYVEVYHKCYDEDMDNLCDLWCNTTNYNSVPTCFNCQLALSPNATNSAMVDRLGQALVIPCDKPPTNTLPILYPGGAGEETAASDNPIEFLSVTSTPKPVPTSTSTNPLTPVVDPPATTVPVGPSTTPSSAAQLVTPRVALLAVVAAVAIAL